MAAEGILVEAGAVDVIVGVHLGGKVAGIKAEAVGSGDLVTIESVIADWQLLKRATWIMPI
jgi:hypothetical protein